MPETCVLQQPVERSLRKVPSCAVMVSSCDAYKDLWKPFFALFWKYWPDCPFPVYLGANQAHFEHPQVRTLNVVEQAWSKNLRWFLEQIETDYVLFLLDDFFLDGPVDTALLLKNLASLDALKGTVLRVYPRPGPEQRLESEPAIGRLHRHAPYRVSAQPAFWNRAHLVDLLRDNESAWQFEWNGTERSQTQESGFYGTYKPLLPYRHVVERGEWFWSAARHYQSEQIGCDFRARPVMGPLKAAKKTANRFRKNIWNAVLPRRWRLRN